MKDRQHAYFRLYWKKWQYNEHEQLGHILTVNMHLLEVSRINSEISRSNISLDMLRLNLIEVVAATMNC